MDSSQDYDVKDDGAAMGNDGKIRIVGAKKAQTQLTAEMLVAFAERVIRTDKQAALNAQKNKPDHQQASNDRPQQQPKVSALNDLARNSSAVKVKTGDEPAEDETSKVVPLIRPFGKS